MRAFGIVVILSGRAARAPFGCGFGRIPLCGAAAQPGRSGPLRLLAVQAPRPATAAPAARVAGLVLHLARPEHHEAALAAKDGVRFTLRRGWGGGRSGRDVGDGRGGPPRECPAGRERIEDRKSVV